MLSTARTWHPDPFPSPPFNAWKCQPVTDGDRGEVSAREKDGLPIPVLTPRSPVNSWGHTTPLGPQNFLFHVQGESARRPSEASCGEHWTKNLLTHKVQWTRAGGKSLERDHLAMRLTHTHTHITHRHKHSHPPMQTQTHTPNPTQTQTHIPHTYLHRQTHTHTPHTDTLTQTHIPHTYLHRQTHTHTQHYTSHTDTPTQTHIPHTYLHRQTHTHTQTPQHRHKHT